MLNQISHLLFRSNRLRLVFGLFVCYYLILWLLWFIFWAFFANLSQSLDWATWQSTLYLQHKFNIRLCAIVILPTLILMVMPRGILKFSHFKFASYFYFTILVFLTLLFYIFNWGHYAYLSIPLDASALRFLDNDDIAMSFIWQSYPVITIVIFWLVTGSILAKLSFLFTNQFKIQHQRQFPIQIRSRLITALLVLLILLGALFGRLSQYPLRWSEAFFHSNPKVAYLSLNPVLYFFDTLKNKNVDYDLDQTRATYPLVASFLGVDEPNSETLSYKRKGVVREPEGEKYNVVFIMLESLGANRLGIFGNPLDATPNLDAIAKAGYFFNNFFVPNTGTARTVYTSLFGLADASPVKTATRNPLIIRQTSIMNDFEGYQKHYLIGGSASWANIRGVLGFNIPDLNLYEGDYDVSYEKVDVWGISDTSLFKKALAVFEKESQQNQPFIAYIQTAGSHRPFTIPEDNENFEKSEVSEEVLIQNGFLNLDQFNGIRFLDHNIGYFFKQFEQSSFYGKTIFVLFGDHNDSTHPAPHMRPLESETLLDGLHVPMIIYAPGIIEPQTFSMAASLVDVFPTVSYLANVPITNQTMGKNLLSVGDDHVAFTLRGNMLNPTIGLVQNDWYFRSFANGENPELFDLRQHTLDPIQIDETNRATYLQLKELSKGIFESTRYLMHHNAE